ncbi:UPF0146 family protein [Haloferacaceae archaeon DSL9]
MLSPARRAAVAYLSRYETLLEVGIGVRVEAASALVDADCAVTAVDVHDREVPPGVRFVRDDVFVRSDAPTLPDHYRVDALYGLNLPPELHRPVADIARRVGADFAFTTLGHDEPTIPVERTSIADDTLYVVARG